jgi:hypothetical protein
MLYFYQMKYKVHHEWQGNKNLKMWGNGVLEGTVLTFTCTTENCENSQSGRLLTWPRLKLVNPECKFWVLLLQNTCWSLFLWCVAGFQQILHFTNDLHEYYISRSTCCLVKYSARKLGMIHLRKNSLKLRLLPLGNTVHINKTGRKLAGGAHLYKQFFSQQNFISAGNNYYH